MICPSCKTNYPAVNQHSMCPECGTVVGDSEDKSHDAILTKAVRWFEDWELATQTSRKESERDHDYYDGMQWTREELAQLQERGQPPIVKNRIFKKINFLLGSEVRNRADPKALPRTKMHDQDSEAITDALRYVCDEQDFDATSSAAWFNSLVEGYCGAVVEHEIVDVEPSVTATPVTYGADATKAPEAGEVDATESRQVEVRIRHVPWDRLWYDIHSRKSDFSDANHLGISLWMDLDDAIREYGDRNDKADDYEEILREAITSSGSSPSDETHEDKPTGVWASAQGNRQRVRISECYYRSNDEKTGESVWYTCHHTKAGFVVKPKPTGYKDENGEDVCPLLMSSGFITREGARYGIVRHMIGPQDEINKRSSKAMHWLSVDRVVAEDGAILNPDEARTERAKPDGWITVQPGALQKGMVQFDKGLDMAQGQVQMLAEAKAEIDTIGPEIPQISSMGSEASGRAIMARQQIGSLELAPLDDAHKRWKRSVYRHIWWRIKQFWPEERWLRVRDDADRLGFRFVALNRSMTRAERFQELMKKGQPLEVAMESTLGGLEAQKAMQQLQQAAQMMQQQQAQMAQQQGQQPPQMQPEQMQAQMAQFATRLPIMQERFVAADVAQLDVDIVLDESPDVSVLQQEEYEKLADLVPAFLQAQQSPSMLLEMMLEASQLRSKRKLLEMMRKPPDQKQMEQQQTMQALGVQQAQANIGVAQSQTELNKARAQLESIKAQTEPAKAQAEAQTNQAKAMHTAAMAGETVGGGLAGMQR